MTALGFVLLALAALPAGLALMNLSVLRRTPRHHPQPDTLVSILIPARNEAENIGPALDAALGTSGVRTEILVRAGGSPAGTAEIVRDHARRDARIRLLTAPPLEEGWTGKVHACHHLAAAARGTHFLFVDADVRLGPPAAALLAGHAQATDSGLVSAVPRQIMVSFGELLTVPTINLLLLSYLPMGFMRLSRDPGLGAACGQLMLVEREAYRGSGGRARGTARMPYGRQIAPLFPPEGLL